jgi:phenylalanyl-tRNA synthetase beta chain
MGRCPINPSTIKPSLEPLSPLFPLLCPQVCRTTLLPSALKTLAANKGEPLPLRLFELSDVVLLDAGRDVGARNERRLLAVTCGKTSEFDAVHGLLNRVMQVLGVPHAGERGT